MAWILALLLGGVARGACPAPVQPAPYLLDEASTDRVPPPGPDIARHDVEVIPGGPGAGCVGGDPACATRVAFDAVLLPEDDDVTPAEDLGYTVRLVDGALPPGITLPEGPVVGPDLRLEYDVARDEVEGDVFAVLEIHAVDRAGNESEGWVRVTVRVETPGGAGAAGCVHATGGGWLAAPMLLGWASRRRPRGARGGRSERSSR